MSQLSLLVGATQLAVPEQRPASALTVMSAGMPLIVGASLSLTKTVCVQVFVLPLTSMTIQVTSVLPTG